MKITYSNKVVEKKESSYYKGILFFVFEDPHKELIYRVLESIDHIDALKIEESRFIWQVRIEVNALSKEASIRKMESILTNIEDLYHALSTLIGYGFKEVEHLQPPFYFHC